MIIEFPEYTPDIAPLNSPGLGILTNNVIPDRTHYSGINSLAAYSNALDDRARGFYAARDPTSGESINFAGTGTKLYKMAAAVWSDVSIAANYTLQDDDYWQFAQFGDRVIAVTIDGDMQVYQLGVSTLFANLSADATRPYARHVDVVNDFVVVGNTWDSVDSFKPYRVRWSWSGDATRWTVSAANQSDAQDLDGGDGWINGIIGGEYGIIFQERAITTMHYVGAPAVFEFKTVVKNNGTVFPNCFAIVGNIVYFIGVDGFYEFDGYNAVPIGVDKVDKTFFDEVNLSFPHRVTAAVDFLKKVVAFSYPDENTDEFGTPTKVLYYNYVEKRWSPAAFTHEMLVNSYSEGYVMDPAAAANGLDLWQTTVQGLGAADLDQLPYSLDSRVWTGNNYILAAFGSGTNAHMLSTFSGIPLTAVLETPEVQLNEGARTSLQRIRALADGTFGTRTVQIGYRNKQSEAVAYTGSFTEVSSGDIAFRNNSRYHRVKLQIAFEGTATNPSFTVFENAIGIDVLEARKEGNR